VIPRSFDRQKNACGRADKTTSGSRLGNPERSVLASRNINYEYALFSSQPGFRASISCSRTADHAHHLANEAAAHVNQYATVEGVVAKVFTSKAGNTFLNIGGTYPNKTFTGWIPPASRVSKSAVLSDPERQHVNITGCIQMFSLQLGLSAGDGGIPTARES
jgi:hypothetical protein